MKTALFLFNPHAGKGKIGTKLASITDTLTKAGFLVTTYPTQAPNDATEKISQWGKFYDRVIVAGGDGMLHEAVNGIMSLIKTNPCLTNPSHEISATKKDSPALAYIPSGTVNDFAVSHKIPKNIDAAVKLSATGTIHITDIGSLIGQNTTQATAEKSNTISQYFSYVAAFGAITDITYTTDQESKNIFGFLAYLASATKYINLKLLLGACRHMVIQTDTQTIEDDFLLGYICNSKTIGSFKQLVPKGADLNDGLFEALFIKKPHTIANLSHVLNLLLNGNTDIPEIVTLKSSHYTITTSEPTEWNLDGEDAGLYNLVSIQAHHQALPIILP